MVTEEKMTEEKFDLIVQVIQGFRKMSDGDKMFILGYMQGVQAQNERETRPIKKTQTV